MRCLWATLLLFLSAGHAATVDGPRYFHIPSLEIMQNDIFLAQTDHQETVVVQTGKGSDLHSGDYLTHADGVRILNGGLKAFLKNGDNEAIVPIIDEEDQQHGGNKLIGFVLVQVVTPRKLSTRRGEIVFDLEEGGPAPTAKLGNLIVTAGGVKSTTDPSYQPPPYGGGACLTAKDCYNYNGTCSSSKCSCSGPYTGTYCQLNRPESAAVSMMMRKAQLKLDPTAKLGAGATPTPIHLRTAAGVDAFASHRDKAVPAGASQASLAAEVPPAATARTSEPAASSVSHAMPESSAEQAESAVSGGDGAVKKKKKKKPMPKKKPTDADEEEKLPVHDWSRDDPQNEAQQPQQQQQQQFGGSHSASPEQQGAIGSQSDAATVEDLYGDGKAYPEPYTAGRLPSNIQQDRHRKRFSRTVFVYSVRYRSGPLGLVFDNKLPDTTVVEKVVKGQQSDLSDVKEGDVLLAIDQYNVSTAPAKVAQRVLSSLPWPRILVFQTRYVGEDPSVVAKKISSRTFNASVVFPPTLFSDFSFRLADWTPSLQLFTPVSPLLKGQSDFCPIYRIKTPTDDIFGCKVASDEYALPGDFEKIAEANGFVGPEIEAASPFLALVMQEAKARGVAVEPRSLAITKRGLCTFVEKSRTLAPSGAHFGLVVNTDDEVIDMPAGKENTADSSVPLGLLRFSEGEYLHLAARTNEAWAILGDATASGEDGDGLSPTCRRLSHIVEDIVDKWPHSMPPLTAQQIKGNKAPDQTKIRGLTEEGGRIALSGENGWVFFDYHLAMFGPQEVPLGPNRLVMAMPPFGCDPNAFTSRISNAVVAILRGGGCSFGIKVINAQKLGAKAVIIVNTDDMKTMRLMALPDEVPLIKIPCIMVSRRIQFYFEEQLRPYYPLDRHLVSIQPTGVFGDYEQKNSLTLPVRLQA